MPGFLNSNSSSSLIPLISRLFSLVLKRELGDFTGAQIDWKRIRTMDGIHMGNIANRVKNMERYKVLAQLPAK